MRDVHGEFGLINVCFVRHTACNLVEKNRGKTGVFSGLESGNLLTVNCAGIKVDKNIDIFAAHFIPPTRDRHLDTVSNEHRP